MKQIPLAVWRLTVAYAMMMAGMSLMVMISGIIGTSMAPSETLATLPVALVVIGVAASTLPTGRLLARWGRKPVFLAYGVIAIAGALLAMVSVSKGWFSGLCAAALLMGWSGAAGHQYRFAALELVPAHMIPKATSTLLFGGILAAFIGPEIAVRGRFLLEDEYSGSFLLLLIVYVLGLLVISFYRDSQVAEPEVSDAGRPLGEILKSPVVFIAITSAGVGYGVMSFLMTATPISMHNHAGHSLETTKFIIQSHIVSMYLPSLFYAWFQQKLGYRGMLWIGVVMYLACVSFALLDTAFIHYWSALIMLGIGWNVLFLTGTNLLPQGYRPQEKYRVQSSNDFFIFSVQALASLSAGWALAGIGWTGMLSVAAVAVTGFALLLVFVQQKLQ